MNVGARHAVPLRHAPKGAAWEFRQNDDFLPARCLLMQALAMSYIFYENEARPRNSGGHYLCRPQ